MSRFNVIVVVFAFLVIGSWSRISAALPVVVSAGLQTNRFGLHALPGWLPVGDKLEVLAFIESSDPAGSPTIVVDATSGGTTHYLEYVGHHPLYEPFAVAYYETFLDFTPSVNGVWSITATDSSGSGFPTLTEPILEPEFLPLVEDVTVQGSSLGASVSWALPAMDGYDADDVSVRLIEATTGSHVWQSESLPLDTTSFAAPAALLQSGVDYVFGIILGDLESPYYENLSWTFSQAFRLTIAGDYNQNGTVDAADYTVWRDNLSSGTLVNRGAGISGPVDADDYEVWKSNFGQTLGLGSGTPPAVPEPATCLLCVLALGNCPSRWRHRSDFSRQSSIRGARLLNSVSPG